MPADLKVFMKFSSYVTPTPPKVKISNTFSEDWFHHLKQRSEKVHPYCAEKLRDSGIQEWQRVRRRSSSGGTKQPGTQCQAVKAWRELSFTDPNALGQQGLT